MEDRYRIDMLLGCCLLTVGRAADLVWWQFEKDGIPYALHTQCAFRVTHEGVLLVTRSSIYDVFEDNDDPHNNRVFDKNVVKLNQLLPAKVLQVECSPMNDLRIMTGNQLCIEILLIMMRSMSNGGFSGGMSMSRIWLRIRGIVTMNDFIA